MPECCRMNCHPGSKRKSSWGRLSYKWAQTKYRGEPTSLRRNNDILSYNTHSRNSRRNLHLHSRNSFHRTDYSSSARHPPHSIQVCRCRSGMISCGAPLANSGSSCHNAPVRCSQRARRHRIGAVPTQKAPWEAQIRDFAGNRLEGRMLGPVPPSASHLIEIAEKLPGLSSKLDMETREQSWRGGE